MARCGTTVCALALVVGACPAARALGDVVFFDDFDGNALAPHWSRPPAWHWEYNVSGGRLNVTDLFYPSNPHLGPNEASIGARYEPQTDFRADVWMGWETGDPWHKLSLYLISPDGFILAGFGYEDRGPGPVIFAGASGQRVTVPAPAPGMHHFTIRRTTGAKYEFYLDGSPFASIIDSFPISVSNVVLDFFGPYPGQFGAVHIDRVVIVPAPSVLVVATPLLLAFGMRRRR